MRPDCQWCQEGRHHLHASDLGKCSKAVIAERLGNKPIPHNDLTLHRFREGHLHEADVIENRLPPLGWEVRNRQDELVLEVAGIPILTHVDGTVQMTGEHPGVLNRLRVLEVKAPGKDEYKKWIATKWDTPGLWQQYKWATSCYMHAWGVPRPLELMMAVKNRETGELDISFLEMPFYSLDEITARVAYIEDHVTRGQLPEDCPHDWFCSFKYLCQTLNNEPGSSKEVENEPAVNDPMFEQKLLEYHRRASMIKELKDANEEARADIDAWLKLSGRTRARVGDYQVTWVTREIPESTRKASIQSFPQVKRIEGTDDATPTARRCPHPGNDVAVREVWLR